MLRKSSSITGRPIGWRTAGICDQIQTRLLVGRLSDAGIDHLTSAEGGESIRVAVRTPDLERALDLRDDLRLGNPKPPRHEKAYYEACSRSLISIPLGWSFGNAICYWLALETPVIPLFMCVLTIAVMESAAGRVHDPRLAREKASCDLGNQSELELT